MTISIRFPDLGHWKTQVKCQTGCPVSTDAGRDVQLIAKGRDEEAYLVARAPNAFSYPDPLLITKSRIAN